MNLLNKLFDKQEKSCCTVKIEEVKELEEVKEIEEVKDGKDSCCNVKIEEVQHT